MTIAFETAEARLRDRLSEKAVEHSVRVADMAGLLATIYSVDAEAARLAGLLHDWDREQTAEELLETTAAEGRTLDPAERAVPYLLHAKTGADALRSAFPGIAEDVVHAVECHTLGALEMSDLDKVVYIADMIEPSRTHAGVDDLREAAGTVSLEVLFAQAYQQSVAHLVECRKTIHPQTVAVWNRYVARPQL